MNKRFAILLATAGYAGHFPIAPGTVGSAVGLALFAVIRLAGSPLLEVGTAAILYVVGVWAAGVAESHYGRTDPGYIVIDEVAGMLVTLLLIPVSWTGAIIGFFIFRLYDIVKPLGARQCERMHGGFGVMTDDIVAGVYGNITLRVLVWVLPALT
ncbi:MAG: phosphatidylglycerophosphatase A [Acidobacteria bacterium]|nr:MAG: phosphatidylglycerophosphatase A [Acidobacteriota bacterium]